VCDALFNTPCFLLLFLPATLAGYWLLREARLKVLWITTASFVFYGFWDARFALLLVAAATVDYLAALGMASAGRHRKAWLVTSIAFNLGLLAFFKYAGFAVENARSLLALLGIPGTLPHYDVVLPVGISFFTFKSMSYTIDVYRGEVPLQRSYLKYLCFISLFPELVAGPIVRYRNVAPTLDDMPRRLDGGLFAHGTWLFVIGLAKKVIVADAFARIVDPLWLHPHTLTAAQGYVAVLGYAFQLYFDFSGYSDMAIGLGLMLGFRFPLNFNSPYKALNPSDFWRRWHVSLSTWLRDYLYIGLGGNRKGRVRTAFNLMATMVLGGLWHGAAWTFVLWGAFHGALLVAYRAAKDPWDAMPRPLQRALTFLLVVAGWSLFRSPSLAKLADVWTVMLAAPNGWGFDAALLFPAVLIAIALAVVMLARNSNEMEFKPTLRHATVAATLFAVSFVLIGRGESPFLYYQF
jgi:alginate O-acetyltransferase complex protein AlgI